MEEGEIEEELKEENKIGDEKLKSRRKGYVVKERLKNGK